VPDRPWQIMSSACLLSDKIDRLWAELFGGAKA
jgi:hypothetical protein